MSTFKRRLYVCGQCGTPTGPVFAWDYDPLPEHCGVAMYETGHGASIAHGVIDDQLEGGPRRFETLGDDAPFIESKSQLKREAEARGLINVGDRKPASYFERQRRLHMEELRDTGRSKEY